MKYYKLPKSARWLIDGDNPYDIGGRATDVEQLGHSICSRVEEALVDVPKEIKDKVDTMVALLTQADELIQTIIEEVSDVVMAGKHNVDT